MECGGGQDLFEFFVQGTLPRAPACPGRHTLTSVITTGGRQFHDWKADYAHYARQRVDPGALFSQVRREIEAINPKHLTDFMNRNPSATKSVKCETDMCSAILASTA